MTARRRQRANIRPKLPPRGNLAWRPAAPSPSSATSTTASSAQPLMAPASTALRPTTSATPSLPPDPTTVQHAHRLSIAHAHHDYVVVPAGASRPVSNSSPAQRIAERAGRRSATPLCSALVPAFCAVGRCPCPPYRQKGTSLGVGRGDGPSITMVVGSFDRHSKAGCALCGRRIAPWGSPRRTGPWPAVATASSHRTGLMAAPWRGARYAGVPRSGGTRGGPWHGPA